MKPRCRNCRVNEAAIRKRGLCQSCFRVPAIRARFPLAKPRDATADMTDAELDALIARRRPTMPPRKPGPFGR